MIPRILKQPFLQPSRFTTISTRKLGSSPKILPKTSPDTYWDEHGPYLMRLLQTRDVEGAKQFIQQQVFANDSQLAPGLVQFLRWNAFPEMAEWVYRNVSKRELNVEEMSPDYNVNLYEEIVLGYLWIGDWSRAMLLAEKLPNPHLPVYTPLALLNALGMNASQLIPQNTSFTAIVLRMQSALSTKHSELHNSKNWSAQQYFWIIRTLLRLDLLSLAQKFFELHWSVPRDFRNEKEAKYILMTFDMMMRAHGMPRNQGGNDDLEKALMLYKHLLNMHKQGRAPSPNMSIFTTLLRLRSSIEDPDVLVDKLLREMSRYSSPLDPLSVSHEFAMEIILAHCRRKNSEEALKWLDTIVKDWGLTMPAAVYSSISSVFLEKGQYENARRVIDELFHTYNQRYKPMDLDNTFSPRLPPTGGHIGRAAMTSQLVNHHPMRKRPDNQPRSYHDPDPGMIENSLTTIMASLAPDTTIYNNLIAIDAAQGKIDQCMATLKKMRRGRPRLSPTCITYTHLVKAFAMVGKSPSLLLQEMSQDSVRPDAILWNSILHAETVLDPIKAVQVLKLMKDQGVVIDDYSYLALDSKLPHTDSLITGEALEARRVLNQFLRVDNVRRSFKEPVRRSIEMTAKPFEPFVVRNIRGNE